MGNYYKRYSSKTYWTMWEPRVLYDYSPPYIENAVPGDGDSAEKDAIVNFDIVDDGQGVNTNDITVYLEGSIAYQNGAFVAPYNGASSSAVDLLDGRLWRFRIQKTSDWTIPGNTIVRVVAEDAAGNILDTSWSFNSDPEYPYTYDRSPDIDEEDVRINTDVSFYVVDNRGVDPTTLDCYVDGYWAFKGSTKSFQAPFDTSSTRLAVTSPDIGYFMTFVRDGYYDIGDVDVRVLCDDYNNNSLDQTWTFTTLDTEAPFSDSVSPADDATCVDVDEYISGYIYDRNAVKQDTVRLYVDGSIAYNGDTDTFTSPYDGAASVVAPASSGPYDGYFFQLDRSPDFDTGTEYTLNIYAEDADGYSLDEYHTFLTNPDIITASSPEDAETDVDTQKTLSCNFYSYCSTIVASTIDAYVDGDKVYNGSTGTWLSPFEGAGSVLTPISGTTALGNYTGYILYLDHTALLDQNTSYDFRFTAQTADGKTVDETVTFTTKEDICDPVITHDPSDEETNIAEDFSPVFQAITHCGTITKSTLEATVNGSVVYSGDTDAFYPPYNGPAAAVTATSGTDELGAYTGWIITTDKTDYFNVSTTYTLYSECETSLARTANLTTTFTTAPARFTHNFLGGLEGQRSSYDFSHNGTDQPASWAYHGADANLTSWIPEVGAGTLSLWSTGQNPTLDWGSPLIGRTRTEDSVRFNGGKFYRASSSATGNLTDDDFILEFVVLTPDIGETITYVNKSGWSFGISPGAGGMPRFTVTLNGASTSRAYTTSTTFEHNCWYHVCVVGDVSGYLRIYVNGSVIGLNGSAVMSDIGSLNSAYIMTVGNPNDGGAIAYMNIFTLDGWIDTATLADDIEVRFIRWTGVCPDHTNGTDVPVTRTRAAVAHLERVEASGKIQMYKVGGGWMRVSSRKDPEGTIVVGYQSEDIICQEIGFTEQFDSWSTTNATVGVDAEASPRRDVTADAIKEDTTSGGHRVYDPPASLICNGVVSVYAKAGTRDWIILEIVADTGYGHAYCYFDVANGTVGTSAATVACTIEDTWIKGPFYNDYYRCSFSFDINDYFGVQEMRVWAATGDGGHSYSGVNGAEAVYIWGASLTEDEHSYVYNVGSTSIVTDYDILEFSSVDNIYDESGTVDCDFLSNIRADSNGTLLNINNSGTYERIQIYVKGTDGHERAVIATTTDQEFVYTPVVDTRDGYKHESNLIYEDGYGIMLLDGSAGSVNTDVEITSNYTKLTIGPHDGLISKVIIRR